jgi:hypothetical protein
MHHAVGFGLAVALIAFAFGERSARAVVGSVLTVMALAFAYVMIRIISGTI